MVVFLQHVVTLLMVATLILAVAANDFDHDHVNHVSSSSLVKRRVVVVDRDVRTAPRRTQYLSLQQQTPHQIHPSQPACSFSMTHTLRGGSVGYGRKSTVKSPKVSSSEDSGASGGQSSILSSVFNLVNNVAGAGILTLSAGMAPGTGYVPAMIICAILGWWSGHCFVMVGQACELTSQGDFKGLWKTTMGADSAWVVDAIIAVMCVAAAIIYSGILGDVFTPLLAQAGFPSHYNGRTSNS
jgi:hypothetical protein